MDTEDLQIPYVDGNHFTTLESWSLLLNAILICVIIALL